MSGDEYDADDPTPSGLLGGEGLADELDLPSTTDIHEAQWDAGVDRAWADDRVPFGLTLREWRFLNDYLACFNGAAAAKRAGYAYPSDAAWRVLRRPRVKVAHDRMLEERAKLYSAQHCRILQEVLAVALSDLGDYAKWNGEAVTLKSSDELTGMQRRAIKSITSIPTKFGNRVKIELHSKGKAEELLMRHTGMLRDSQTDDRRHQIVLEELQSISGKVVGLVLDLCSTYIQDPSDADAFIGALSGKLGDVVAGYQQSVEPETALLEEPKPEE